MEPSWIEIASPQNPTIREVSRLRKERQRKRQQRILIDGVREIQRAVTSDFEIESLFVCESVRGQTLDPGLIATFPCRQRFRVAESAFQKIAFGDRNEGIVAVAFEKHRQLDSLPLSPNPFMIVLDGIEKPGNVGAVFRTASAAGVDAILLTNDRCSPFNANAVRASLGTVFELPFFCGSTEDVTGYLTDQGVRIVTTRVDVGIDYTDFDYSQPVALVLGSEADGVTADWLGFDSVTIPMNRSVDSLNISVTAAIVAFEARRQRKC